MPQNFKQKAIVFITYVVVGIVIYEIITWSVLDMVRDGNIGQRLIFIVAALAAHGAIKYVKDELIATKE